MKNETLQTAPPIRDIEEQDDILERINVYPYMFAIALFLVGLIVPYRGIRIPHEMMLAAGGISLIFFALISLESHYLTLLILAVYLPFSKALAGDFGNFMTGFNLTNILTGLIIAGWVARAAFHRQRFFLAAAADLPIFLFAFLALLSLIRGGMETLGLSPQLVITLKRYLTPIFLYYVFSSNVRTAKQARAVIICNSIVVALITLMALKEFYIDIGGVGRLNKIRIRGICDQSNNTGAFFVFYSLFPIIYYLTTPAAKRFRFMWLSVPWAFVSFWAMSRTFSRGATLSFVFTFCSMLFYHNWRKATKLVLPLLLLVVIFPNLIPESVIGRFVFFHTKDEISVSKSLDESSRDRLHLWLGALRMMYHNPIIGIGYGLYQRNVEKYANMDFKGTRDAHQGLLLIGAEMGPPALLIFLFIMLIFLLTGRSIHRRSDDDFFRAFGLFIMTMCVGVFTANFFGDRLRSQELASYYWVFGGISMVVSRLLDEGRIASKPEPAPPARPQWARSMQEIRAANTARQ